MRKRVFREECAVNFKYSFLWMSRYNLAFVIIVLSMTGALVYATILTNFKMLLCFLSLAFGAGLVFAVYKYLRPPITLKEDGFVDYSNSAKYVGFVPWGRVKDISFAGGRSITAHIYNPATLTACISPKAQEALRNSQPVPYTPIVLIVPAGYEPRAVFDFMQEYLDDYLMRNPEGTIFEVDSYIQNLRKFYERYPQKKFQVKRSGIMRYLYILLSLILAAASVLYLAFHRLAGSDVAVMLLFELVAVALVWFASGRPLLTLTLKGFIDNSSLISAGFIPWELVFDIAVTDFMGQPSITVRLHDTAAYLETLSPSKRNMAESRLNRGRGPINIDLTGTSMDPDDILSRMIEFRSASRKGGSWPSFIPPAIDNTMQNG